MIFLVFLEFVAFPDREDALLGPVFNNNFEDVNVVAGGSIGLFIDGMCQKTTPNRTLIVDRKFDWCSSIEDKENNAMPWISYNLKNKAMKLTGYSVRNGCCWYSCCCDSEGNGNVIDYDCCCRLYSFTLQGSNDNVTWEKIHDVVKDQEFWACKANTYELSETTKPYSFIRIILDEARPGCPLCMQINQVELYGETIPLSFVQMDDSEEENDESVSIIGKIRIVNN